MVNNCMVVIVDINVGNRQRHVKAVEGQKAPLNIDDICMYSHIQNVPQNFLSETVIFLCSMLMQRSVDQHLETVERSYMSPQKSCMGCRKPDRQGDKLPPSTVYISRFQPLRKKDWKNPPRDFPSGSPSKWSLLLWYPCKIEVYLRPAPLLRTLGCLNTDVLGGGKTP